MKSTLYGKLLLLLLECLTIITDNSVYSAPGIKLKKDQNSLLGPRIETENSIQASKLSKLVVFSFDGFRHDYINPNDTPKLYALAQDGVRGIIINI